MSRTAPAGSYVGEGRPAVRTGRRVQSMAALVCGSGGASRRMGGGGLDAPPLPRYDVLSIECGGSSAHTSQPLTTSTPSCAQCSTRAVTFTPNQHRQMPWQIGQSPNGE